MKSLWPALVATLCMVACGSESSTGNGTGNNVVSVTCTPGQTFPCTCQNQQPSTATCQPGGNYAVCACGGPGSGGITAGGGSPAFGGSANGGVLGAGGSGLGGSLGTGGLGTGTGGVLAGSGGVQQGSGGATIGGGGSVGTGGAQQATGGTVSVGGATSTGPSCLQAGGGDYSKPGPYKVAPTIDPDLASFAPNLPSTPTTYTMTFPENLNDGCPHPVVAWGNGTSVTGPQVYAFFHNNLASWGIVVIASDNPNSGGGLGAGGLGDVYLKPAIDYMIAQNADSTSQFYQKLGNEYGTAGHSQGAFAATVTTKHPNVTAEAQVEGGGTPKAGIAFLALSGTADTVVTTSPPTASYTAATGGPAMLAIYNGADHTTTPTLAGWVQQNPGTIAFVRLYTAWFRCYLGKDQTACGVFRGQGCGICSDTNWSTLQSKNL